MNPDTNRNESVELGDVAFESKERAKSLADHGLRVYGVDRTNGLTPDAKYKAKNLELVSK